MNDPRSLAGPWPAIDEKTLCRFDEEALELCHGDAALWLHHRAVLEGEFRIQSKGKTAWNGWMRVRNLPQFTAVEVSVIDGWRKFIANALNIPKEQQADATAINRALILAGCRHAKNKDQAAEVLKARSQSIAVLAAAGHVDFFSSLGRLLGPPSRSSLHTYEYAHAMLSHWLTSYLWLMPDRTASECLARWRGQNPKTVEEGKMVLWHFKKTKRRYQVKSHKPSLVNHIEAEGKLVLTRDGRRDLRAPGSSGKRPG